MRIRTLVLVLCAAAPAVAAPRPTPAAPVGLAASTETLLPAAIERRLHSDNIDASSFLWNDWNKFVENYHPNYIADDDPSTAWVEGAKGSGAGEWLKINVTPLAHTTKIRLRVRNGYQKARDLFAANARAKAVTVRLMPSKVERKLALADTQGWQDLVIEQPAGVVQGIELAVDAAYPGKKYEDLCISDVQVYATSLVPDNPAFEKSKRQTLMSWRAARLAAAKLFRAQTQPIPLYPAYEVTATDVELASDGFDIAAMIEVARKDAGFTKEWQGPLAIAAEVVKGFDTLQRAQLAPVSRDKLVAADGLQSVRVADIVGEGDIGYYDDNVLHLPMLDYVATLFADQLRMIDIKDKQTIAGFRDDDTLCKSDLAWVKRSQPKEQTGPARVQAVMVGRCARVPVRTGSFNAHALELYVYDSAGRLALSIADGHIDGYRWIEDGGRPKLAGGRSLLAQGKLIEAKKREAVAVK